MSNHSKSPWGWGLREFGDHMVFKGGGEGISCRRQSIKVGGGVKIDCQSDGDHKNIYRRGGGGESDKFCRDQTKIHQPLPDGK